MAFSGRATYDAGVIDGIAEDVADLVSMISPFETPLLDALGDAERAATSVLHEWLEDALSPNEIISAAAYINTDTPIQVFLVGTTDSAAPLLQAGVIMQVVETGEVMQCTAIVGNDLTVVRGFGGTTAASISDAGTIFIISDAALEGADVTVDTSTARARLNNYTQIYKKDVIISGSDQATTQLGGIDSEWDYQISKKLRESLRDLEKAAIHGLLSGAGLGSATSYRTMRGIWDFIQTNSTNLGVTPTLTADSLDTVIEGAWNQGATDLDIIVCDAYMRRQINALNDSRVEQHPTEGGFTRRVTVYAGTFGEQQVVLSRWMPAMSFMVLSSERVKVVPLQGRSYFFQEVARTGDAQKGMVLGEYTTMVQNQEGLAKAFGTAV